MKTVNRSGAFIFLFTLLVGISVARAADDEAAIRACFKNYLAAVEKKDGDAAAALISKDSITYYRGILDLAMNADEAALRQQRFYRKMMTLLVRNEEPD